jgi:hypothetical protein
MIDGLRAKGLISWQRKVAKWWSVDLTTAPTCSADEPIRKAMHRQQTAPRPWSGRRAESYAARGTLHSMCAVAPEPLSSRAPPPEVWRARGRSRPAQSCRDGPKFVSFLCVKGLREGVWLQDFVHRGLSTCMTDNSQNATPMPRMRASLTAPGIPPYPQDDETAITGDFTAHRTAATHARGWGSGCVLMYVSTFDTQ